MAKSFFHFLMSFRHPKPVNHINQFANDAYHDHSFPKNSKDYEELSSYLELNGFYLKSMTVFDDAWEIINLMKKKHKDNSLIDKVGTSFVKRYFFLPSLLSSQLVQFMLPLILQFKVNKGEV